MRRIIFLIIIVILASNLLSESTGIPDSKFELMKNYRLGSWGYKSCDLDFDLNGRIDNTSFQRNSVDFGFDPYFDFYMENDNITMKFDNNNTYTFGYNYSDHRAEQFSNSISTSNVVTLKYYYQPNLFVNMGTKAAIYYRSSKSYTEGLSDNLRETFNPRATSNFGFGFGRLYDIYPMIRALRMNERVNSLGKGINLTNTEVADVAHAIAQSGSVVFMRPELPYWSHIASSANGKLDNLSMFDYEYVKDALLENIFNRYQGYDVSFNLNVTRNYQKRYSENPLPATYTRDQTDLAPEIYFRWYNNFSTSFMAGFEQEFSYRFNDYDDQNNYELFNTQSTLLFSYNINDRLLLANTTIFSYNKSYLDKTFGKYEEHTVSNKSSFTYQIIDQLYYYVDLNISNYNTNKLKYSDRFNTGIYTGLSFNLFRKMN